jgi:ABC-type glycerol-3-phosphate transport system substrate-binding protein
MQNITRRAMLHIASGAGTVVGLAAACRPREAAPPVVSAPPVKLLYMGPAAAGSERLQLEKELFDTFNRTRTDIVVEVEGAANWTALKEKFVVMHAGGTPLDIVQNGWGTWTDLADGGVLTELTPFFKRDKVSYDLFLPISIEAYTVDSKLWGMPITISADALAYNMDMFDAVGLPYPPTNPEDKTWTMERFLEHALKLTQPPHQFGFGGTYAGFTTAGVADGTYFGQQAWDDKDRKCLMDTPQFRTGVQFFLDLLHKYHVQPTGEEATAIRAGMSGDLFLTGKIGMQVTLVVYPKERAHLRWGLATLPYSGPGRNQSGRMWPSGLHIGATPRANQAWEVFKWLTMPENGGRFPLTAGHAVSPLVKGGSDLAQRLRQQESGVDPKAWLLQAQYSHLSAAGMLKYANWPRAAAELTPRYADLKAQQISVNEYTSLATEVINRYLAPGK